MKLAPIAIMAVLALAGCQTRGELSLEEAQALCTQQGGLLAVIYTQSITTSSIGELKESPGDCISPEEFETDSPAAGNALPPAN